MLPAGLSGSGQYATQRRLKDRYTDPRNQANATAPTAINDLYPQPLSPHHRSKFPKSHLLPQKNTAGWPLDKALKLSPLRV